MCLLMICSLFYADSSIPSCVMSFLSPEIHWLISFNVYFVRVGSSAFVSLVRIPSLLPCPSCQVLTFCHRRSPPIHKHKVNAAIGQGRTTVWCANATWADDVVQPTVLFKVKKLWKEAKDEAGATSHTAVTQRRSCTRTVILMEPLMLFRCSVLHSLCALNVAIFFYIYILIFFVKWLPPHGCLKYNTAKVTVIYLNLK